jgi:[ribosomal protein S5]-alanine N-acetyltransferase
MRPHILKTSRLTLVPLTTDDAAALFEASKDPASIEDFQTTPRKPEDVQLWVQPLIEGAVPSWTIRVNSRVIGMIQAEIRKGAIADLGFFIEAPSQGMGYATEAIRSVVNWLLNYTKVHRVTAEITATNMQARRVVEKLGFTLEGLARQNWQWKGTWHDSANYAVLRDDVIPEPEPEDELLEEE